MSGQKYLGGCTQVRRVLVTHLSVNIATGASNEVAKQWETKPCNAPLFSDAERDARKCRSCSSGWTHPHNFPVDEAAP